MGSEMCIRDSHIVERKVYDVGQHIKHAKRDVRQQRDCHAQCGGGERWLRAEGSVAMVVFVSHPIGWRKFDSKIVQICIIIKK